MRRARSGMELIVAQQGFTLLEVMVALVVAVLIVGGVMGLFSSSLNFQHRINKKSQVMPVLEAVAQQILLDPESALKGSGTVGELSSQMSVRIAVAKVLEDDGQGLGKGHARLHRVQLLCEGQTLEFSVLIPESDQR